ncbi:MAG TPA: NAD-dependent epimerase/dehydratase family protein [Candidatus Limnocylindria bacterium]|nr:NAD-dependent epimerase/dehydratase family protein [Candidatus Limnocylindria bacterium]
MKYVVTGATGFIGGRLARQLARAEHQVVAIVRDPAKARDLAGVELRKGDVTDRASLREAMAGADGVFHLAGWYALGRLDAAKMQAINVDGARNTLEVAAELGVPRIVHTSTVGVFGNTHGKIVDETYSVGIEAMESEYERTKWSAHYKVAVPLQSRGAPVIIVQPGGVTGAGDTSPHVQTFESFLERIPVMFGAQSGLTWAHVDDVANGHTLAMEKGQPGEAYIIAGPAFTYRQTFELCEKYTGIAATKLWAPGWMAAGMSKLAGVLESVGMHLQFSAEALGTLADYTFWGSAERAQRELGWQPRPVENVLREILNDLQARRTRRGRP